MRYLSVCAGIEAATVAWHHMGWEPAGFSEIEKFPSLVLDHHYPQVPKLGDMTKYKEWNLGTIDLLVGGTPCQSFSVAGLRKGLADPRGNLALVYLGIADAYKPKWIVWENVPGVLSSNGGRDFGSFLGALAELGYGFAYRVLDAQYFGVAQRRRRVFVVGYLGDWRPAAAVLFEPKSLSRNSAPSREKGQITPTLTKECTGVSRPGHNEDGCYVTASTLTRNGAGGNNFECGETYVPAISNCLETTCHDYSRADGFNMVAQPISIQGNLIGREAGGPQGVGASDEGVMYTLTKSDVHGVAVDVYNQSIDGQTAATLTQACGGTNTSGPKVMQPVGVFFAGQGAKAGSIAYNENVSPTLKASDSGTNRTPSAHIGMAVRRLTPVECERLQGFPDGYTDIKPNGKDTPDGPRYKALGNSMAVPVMRWIGERINQKEKNYGSSHT